MYRPYQRDMKLTQSFTPGDVSDMLKNLAWGAVLAGSIGAIAYLLFEHDAYPKKADGYEKVTVSGTQVAGTLRENSKSSNLNKTA